MRDIFLWQLIQTKRLVVKYAPRLDTANEVDANGVRGKRRKRLRQVEDVAAKSLLIEIDRAEHAGFPDLTNAADFQLSLFSFPNLMVVGLR